MDNQARKNSSDNLPPLRIGILGTRGVPARYGGFETFAEELGARLVERGHSVTVYGRKYLFGGGKDEDSTASYRGMRTRRSFTVRHKYLDTPLAALTSLLDAAVRRDLDVIILCNAATSPFAWLARVCGIPVAINVDGIERRRTKWNALGRLWYLLGERCSVWFASRVVSDARSIEEYYRERFGVASTMIAYGAKAVRREPGKVLQEFGVAARGYILYVSRLEPENNALGVVKAFVASGVEVPLVVVGDAPYSDEYKGLLREAANERVIFTGYQFGEAYQEFQSNALLYIQASEVGGTHPALVEAMAYGNAIIANDVPEHREVVGEAAGVYYRMNDFEHLAQLLRELAGDEAKLEEYRRFARARAESLYSWDAVTTEYEALCRELA